MLLSVITPAYKVEEYIERCLRSLQDQDLAHEDYEVIVVNDGSPDRCAVIVESLQREFSNIRLHNQINRGVSIARNEGMRLAKGKFVLFIDPDDHVRANTIGKAVRTADEKNLDMFLLGYEFLGSDGNLLTQVRQPVGEDSVMRGTEGYHISHGAGKVDPDRSWAILYKREFLERNKLTYLPGVPYLEDGEFLARCMCLSSRVAFSNELVYVRTTRPGSATNSNLFTEHRSIVGFIRCAENLRKFQQLAATTECQKRFLEQPIAKFTLLSIQACITFRSIKYLSETLEAIAQAGLTRLNWSETTSPYRIYGRLYNISAFVFIVFYASQLLLKGLGIQRPNSLRNNEAL